MPYFLWEITAKQTRFRLGNNWKHTGIVSRRGRDVMWRINRRRHGLFICAFNRFRIKGPPLPRHADWQEIARHPVRQPKNRYELRRRDKIVSLALPYPPAPALLPFFPPCLVGIGDIAPILRDDSFFLRVMANAGRVCMRMEKSCVSIRSSCHTANRFFNRPARSQGEKENAPFVSVILISDES